MQAHSAFPKERLFALGWIVFGAAVLVVSWRMDRLENLQINPWSAPGLMPGVLGLLMIVFGAALGLRARRREAQPAEPDRTSFPRVLLAAALCVGYAGCDEVGDLSFVVIAKLGVEGLTPYIASLGLYRNKAKAVVGLSEILLREHGGDVPRTREALEALPGVGRKTANVILNTAFGEPVIAVDTHIFRVANRTGLAPGKDVAAVERKLDRTTPDAFKLNAHHWLILHGRYVCIARAPRCAECAILDLCEFRHKNLPSPEPRTAAATRTGAPPRPPAPTVRARGVQPMAKTARAGARRGRAR